jgi:hypothetical protein
MSIHLLEKEINMNNPYLNKPSEYEPVETGHTAQGATNQNAVISLVCGILGITTLPLILSIVAIMYGNRAKGEIQVSGFKTKGYELANAGVVLGYIGIGLALIYFCFIVSILGFYN